MTKETEKLDALLERLRLEQTIEDMQAEIEGRTQTTSQASVDKAMARVEASIERFARGEPVGEEIEGAPAAPAVRARWETLRTGLAWLSISVDSLTRPATAAPAGYRRGPDPDAAATTLEAPADLHWRPTGGAMLSTGQINITLAYIGSGTPTAPAIDLRHEGEPVQPAKTTFNADTGTLTIRLPKLEAVVNTVDMAQGENDGILVINIGA